GRTIKSKEGDDTPKYINNANTPLFNKDTTVFGFDVAAAAAIHADVVYLVEGAPDVLRLHLIGVKNAVACLGSAWTENQLRQLQQCTTKLCFIPDADPPNKEATNIRDKQGIGIQAVIKNAKNQIIVPESITKVIPKIKNANLEIIPINFHHIIRLETLEREPIHKDPFDRLLIAQCIEDRLTFITSDGKVKLYEKYGLDYIQYELN
ncbi:MAG: toprim domain-containing protein, partial [Bacteroidales bacterium]|nr:toprim domain-containing protein [Bacteroidales bacterium]